jgi:hypothetical protein
MILTDDVDCANRFLEVRDNAWEKAAEAENESMARLRNRIFDTPELYAFTTDAGEGWNYLLIAESAGEWQYDILIEMARDGVPLPHGLLCLAGKGSRFHGFRGRQWDSYEYSWARG